MALERFQGGMDAYLDGVEKAKRRQAGEKLTEAARRLSDGEDVDQAATFAADTNKKLGGEVILIKSLHAEVAELVRVIQDGLKKVGVGSPPLEVLREAPYEITLESAEQEERRFQAKQQIRTALGLKEFDIPRDPDDSEREIPLDKIGLLRKTQTILEGGHINSVRELVARPADDLLRVKNFRDTHLEDVLEGLFRAGALPVPEGGIPAASNPTGQ